MRELYYKYIYILLHPITSLECENETEINQTEYSDENVLPLGIIKKSNKSKVKVKVELSIKEIILLSWPFYFMSVIYKIFFNTFFPIYFKNFSIENNLISDLTSSFHTYFTLYDNFSLLFKFVIFPMFLLLYLRLWKFIIKISLDIISLDKSNIDSEQIIIHSFVSHIFLVIPIFGPFLTFTSHIFYVYLGLRKLLSLNRIQSFFIITAPLLLLLFFIFLIICLYSMMFVLA